MKRPQPLFSDIGIVALVPDKWGPQWMDRHYVANELAKYFHVVWMYQPAWRECVSMLSKNGQSSDLGVKLDSLHVYRAQPWLPRLGRPDWLATWTARQRLKEAYNSLRRLGCKKLVLYLWRPEFADA